MAKSHKETAPGRVGVISLGCPKNLVDTEGMLGRFLKEGYRITGDPTQADVLVVNTCGFVADAAEESRAAIREMAALKRARPKTRLVVTGCLAQRLGDTLAQEFPEVDLLLGSGQYAQLLPLLRDPAARTRRSWVAPPGLEPDDGTLRPLSTRAGSAYLKIAEGCSNPCAFCIIPQLRGPYRSRGAEEILREAETLAGRGVRELNLVSQDTTLYGRDLTPRTDLATLLTRLDAVAGLAWIRLLYLYPTLLNEPLVQTMAGLPRVLPYLDLPLQHSHSQVLKRMKRAEREEDIRQMLERIRRHLPHAVLRTTFIVGFPGESEEEFAHLLRFVEEGHFDHVGVFCYSDEAEAEAFGYADKIPAALAQERLERVMLAQQAVSRRKLAAWVGEIVPVLVEGQEEGKKKTWIGRTHGQAPEVDGIIRFRGKGRFGVGDVVPVRVTGAEEYDLEGKLALDAVAEAMDAPEGLEE